MLRVDINLVFTVINILLLMIAFRIFLFKPVNKIIEKRQEEVDKGFKDAEEKVAEANALKEKCEQDAKVLEEQKENVLKEAKNNAMAEYNRIVTEAEITAREMKDEARLQAESTRQNLLKKTESEYARLVVDAAKKVIADQASEELDSALYDEFLEKVGEKA